MSHGDCSRDTIVQPVYVGLKSEKVIEIDQSKLDMNVVPIEVKSGKDCYIHSALSKALANRDYGIQKAYVLSNGNIQQEERTIYLPVYLASSIREQTAIGILPPL